jgi:hypothetical protein
VSVLKTLGISAGLGLGLGVLVGGVGGRLAMFALIRLNPDQVGTRTDDGFTMGQLTLSGSLNLIIVAGVIGAIGGLVYAAARHLMFGPRWWQVASVMLSAGLTVGAMLVHTDGVDFNRLRPAGLAIGLFVAIPATYGLLLTTLAERRLAAPRRSWGRGEPVRWLLRAACAAIVVVGLLDLADDTATLV